MELLADGVLQWRPLITAFFLSPGLLGPSRPGASGLRPGRDQPGRALPAASLVAKTKTKTKDQDPGPRPTAGAAVHDLEFGSFKRW